MTRLEVLEKFDLMQETMLATTDGDRAYVRPVILVYYKERFFIATGDADAKCAQIRKQANAEVCYYPNTEEKGCYIRINGKANLINDIGLKGEIMEVATFIKRYWTDPADSGYAVIEIVPDWFSFMPYGANLEERV
ncbi:MAG: pyridoxamine 5'-phosphate oxidase family protein [Candidatus Stygibacter australis]|nr:pyridoxamine 5'-phosphate oxidase family protein [Candidatus Stygibacter australis]MDP8321064.1 pyridoxamine 5'-phosphate oxidase family protein [Candidatus Stygibacter australis]